MKIAIIGGGINGLCTAWQLSKENHEVTLYEKNELMQATSKVSSKMLHGGLRYLENFEFRLVKESLRERSFWVENVPHLAWPLKIYLPVYSTNKRSAWKIQLGLALYNYLAGSNNIGKAAKDNLLNFLKTNQELKTKGLKSIFHYFDAQMHDEELGLWVAEQVKLCGVKIHEHTNIKRIYKDGSLDTDSEKDNSFDIIVNTSGPWAEQLLNRSHIETCYSLDLIRGSHIIVEKKIQDGYILETPEDHRVVFVLPYKNQTMIGTTEVRQTLEENIEPSKTEINYLLNTYNNYFIEQKTKNDIVEMFAGIRPLIKSSSTPSKLTREYAFSKNGRILSVFGGKWTTARALAKKVAKEINNYAIH